MEAPRIVPVRVALLEHDQARARVLGAEPDDVLCGEPEEPLVGVWRDGGIALVQPTTPFDVGPYGLWRPAYLVDASDRVLEPNEHEVRATHADERAARAWLDQREPFPPVAVLRATGAALCRVLTSWLSVVERLPGLLEQHGDHVRVWTAPVAASIVRVDPDLDLAETSAECVYATLLGSCWDVDLATGEASMTRSAALVDVTANRIDTDCWHVFAAAAVPALREGLLHLLAATFDVTVLDPSALLGFALPDRYQPAGLTATERQLRRLYYSGLSDEEIGNALSKDAGTVANMLSDLRRRRLVSTRRPR